MYSVHRTGFEECVQPCGGNEKETVMLKPTGANLSTEKSQPIQVAGRKYRAKFSLSNIEGGKFSLKLNKENRIIQDKFPLNVSGESDSQDSSSIKPSFYQASTHAMSEPNEGNETLSFFNNIKVTQTPKRKSSVANLTGIISDNTNILPGIIESPAKKKRVSRYRGPN